MESRVLRYGRGVPVRRKKRPQAGSLSKTEAEVARALAPTKGNVELWETIRRMQIAKSDEEIATLIADDYGISHTAMKSACKRVRARTVALGTGFAKDGRLGQIVELRARAVEASLMIQNERHRERLAEQAAKEGKNPKPYKRRINTPTEAEVRALHELIAKLEGNFAPQKHVNVNLPGMTQATLDFLGVQSTEEIAELLDEGTRIVETTGHEIADVG